MDVISEIVEKIRDNKVVLWVGAGFSLYAGLPSANKLKDMIIDEMFKISKDEKDKWKEELCLSDVTSRYIFMDENSDVNRNRLLDYLEQIFTERFDIKKLNTHSMVKDIPNITEIITTNYDTLFEQVYGDSIDSIFNNNSYGKMREADNVKLYKIHGDFNDYSSIVLSKEDYERFLNEANNNLIWNHVKDIISHKTIIFIGFSYEDINVSMVFKEIAKLLGKMTNKNYLVVPNLDKYKQNQLKTKNIYYINSTGEEFLKKVSSYLKKDFIYDIEDGKIPLKKAITITKEKGFIPEFKSYEGNLKLTSIKSSNKIKDMKMNVNIRFNNNKEWLTKINNHILGKTLGVLDIPDNIVLSIYSEIAGYDVSHGKDVTSIERMQIIHYPDYKKSGKLFYDNFVMPDNVEVEKYSSKYAWKIVIKHEYYNIDIFFDSQNEKVKYRFEGKSLENIKSIYEEHLRFEKLMFLYNSEYIFLNVPDEFERVPIIDMKAIISKNKKLFKKKLAINEFEMITKKLYEIENYFRIKFPVLHRFTAKDKENINFVNFIIKNITDKTNEFIYLEKSIIDSKGIDNLDDVRFIVKDYDKFRTIQLFGYKFIYNGFDVLSKDIYINTANASSQDNKEFYMIASKQNKIIIKHNINVELLY